MLLWNYYKDNNLKFNSQLYNQFIKEITKIVTSRIKNQDEDIKKLCFSVIYNLLKEVNLVNKDVKLSRQLKKVKDLILDKDYDSWVD